MVMSVDCDLFLYADDSALVVSGDMTSDIEIKLNQNLASVNDWLIDNRLSLHLGKTESICFGTKQRLNTNSSLKIRCNNIEIDSKSKVKYLGALLEQDLSGKLMADKVIKKVNSCLKFLYRKREFLDLKERKLVVSALIQPHFDYGSGYWYRGLTKYLKCRLQCAQNKLVRYMLGLNCRSHVDSKHLSTLNWLNIQKRVDYLTASQMHSIFHRQVPYYMFKQIKITNPYKLSCLLPSVKSKGLTSFMYNALKLWNSLPVSLKSNHLRNSFKSNCKKFLARVASTEDQQDFIFY